MSTGNNCSDQAVKETLRTIGTLFEPGDVIEIRALDVGRTSQRSGYTSAGYFNFENVEAISSAVRSVDGRAEGVYVVLNRFNPVLLARAVNRLQAKPKCTTSDGDIIERRWLYIDADALRPAGISATEAEREAARTRAMHVRDYLAERGWPEPVHADSGNGAHLLYRLPAIDLRRSGELVKGCLRALSARFSDHIVKIDESTATAARLCKLYGTMARKGDSTPDRQHRRSLILDTPDRSEPVPIDALEALLGEAPVKGVPASQDSKAAQTGLDIDQWIERRGLEIIKGPEPYSGGRRFTLRTCPFNPTHEKPVIIQLLSGALSFKCLHNSCAKNDWREFRRLLEPDYQACSLGPNGRVVNCESQVPSGVPSDDTSIITDLSRIPSVFSLDARLNWCVDEMIARASVTLICSESGTGKTWLGYHIAGCVANGVPILGRPVQRSKVLYLDGENPLYTVKQRLIDLGVRDTCDLTIWGGWNQSPPQGPQNPLIFDFARREKPLVIFDSLIEFHPGSEQSSTETRAFMKYFRALANVGATIVVLHHSGKAETAKIYRGSSDIKAAVDTAYQLERVDKESNRLGRLSLKCFKGRLTPGQNFALEFRPNEGFVACDVPVRAKTIEETIHEFLEANPNSNQTKIVEHGRSLGYSKGQMEQRLRDGHWRKTTGPSNSTLYSLVLEDPGQDGGD